MEQICEENKMNILMAFNSNYLKPAMVTLVSLALNNPCDIRVFIMQSRLTDSDKKTLELLATKLTGMMADKCEMSLAFVDISSELFEECRTLGWISKETYYRLLAQKLLPDYVKRFLWLDSDIVVKSNIIDFYNMDFEGQLLVATSLDKEDNYNETYRTISYLPANHRYFNAGVLLYNLELQRQQLDANVYEQYLKVFDKYIRFADQDVLNAVFHGLTKYVERDLYNFPVHAYGDLPLKEQNRYLANSKIIHYNGNWGKPWEEQYGYLHEQYFWKYANILEEFQGEQERLKKYHKKCRRKYLIIKKNEKTKE